MSLRVCIADDHLLVLTGIRRALEDAEDVEVLGDVQRGDEVLDLVARHEPDVLLLDNRMPGMDGLECLKLIRERHPQVKVVMISASEEPTNIAEALASGASAYIGKRINPRDLASALRQIVADVVHRAGPVLAEPETPAHDLTERELTMLEAISRGLSTKAISRELWISEKTVTFHLTNIYRKLGVHNRTGAMRYAVENNLIPAAPQAAAATGTG